MARQISQIIDDLISNVKELKRALDPITRLVEAFKSGDGPFPFKTARRAGKGPRTPRKSASLGKAAPNGGKAIKKAGKPNAGRQAQGRYMGLVRNLSKADKAEVKKVRAEKGVEEAIKVAMAKKG